MSEKPTANKDININIDTQPKMPAYSGAIVDTLTTKINKQRIIDGQLSLFDIDEITGETYYNSHNAKYDITIKEKKGGDIIAVSPTTSKILTFCFNKLQYNFNGQRNIKTEDYNALDFLKKRTVSFTLYEYMENVGITDEKTARQNIKKAVKELQNKSIKGNIERTLTTYNKAGKKITKRERIPYDIDLINARIGDIVKNGTVAFIFSDTAMPFISEYITDFPQLINSKTNIQQYPSSQKIGMYLWTMHRLNKNKPNYNRVTVDNIIKHSEIPSYETIKKQRGSYKQKIINPLLATLDHLKDIGLLTGYRLIDKKTKIAYMPTDYDAIPITYFISAIVEFSTYEDTIKIDKYHPTPEQ